MSGGIVSSAGASATTIKNAVWNALTSAHTTVGSFGVLLKDELAKFGTLVNTGGTATLGGMIGDTANSTIVQRLDAIPTGGGGGKQTQITFDNGIITMAASSTVTYTPAVGQTLDLQIIIKSFVSNNIDYVHFSGDYGVSWISNANALNGIGDRSYYSGWGGDSVNRLKIVTGAAVGDREYMISARLTAEETWYEN